jgi:hypothetical protein
MLLETTIVQRLLLVYHLVRDKSEIGLKFKPPDQIIDSSKPKAS